MKITLNGRANEEFESPMSVAQLLEELGLTGQPVLVELDEVALRPREFDGTEIKGGSRLEIIRVAAGG